MSSSPAGVFQRRKAYLSLALRRARSGSGSSRNFLRTRLWKGTPVTLDLAQLHTPFAVVGGVATRLYMSFRVTLDLDLFVTASEAPALDHELWQLGCTQEGALGVGGTTWRTAAGEPLVAWLGQEPWAAEAVEQPNRAPDGTPVIALPYLVLLKLAASRAQDIADLSRMLGAANEAALRQVRDAVRRYRPADLDDLESLILLGQLEYRAGG
jgi:hypothetical protein